MRNANRKFYVGMEKIQMRMKDGILSNRAKLNYLQIVWDKQIDKLIGAYAAKNSKPKTKGEYSTLIG